MKWMDILIIIIIAGIAAFTFFSKPHNSEHLYLSVRTANSANTYKLSQYKIITNTGPIGRSILVISNGTVYMRSSPCSLQICVKEGRIRKQGQSIVCIPNKIEAVLISSNKPIVDSVAR